MTHPTTIEHVRVFDGEELSTPRAVHIDGAEIVARPPPGVASIDGTGSTLLPGLIDTHVYIETPTALERCAEWGVTTALDMGTPHPELTLPLRHLEGVTDLFSAGYPAAAPGAAVIHGAGYPELIAVSGPAAAEAFVADRARQGADYLTIRLEGLDPDTVAALVASAHRHAMKVVAHTVSDATVRVAAGAGADVITGVPVQKVIGRDLAGTGLVVSPTLTMMRGVCSAQDRAPALRALAALHVVPRRDYANARASVTRLHAAGATILAGTGANADPGAPYSPPHGAAMHDELRLLVEAGLSPVEALRAATVTAAAVFGLADRGAVTPGRRADLLLLDGDPTADITATTRIRHVWAGGRRVR